MKAGFPCDCPLNLYLHVNYTWGKEPEISQETLLRIKLMIEKHQNDPDVLQRKLAA